MAIPYEFLAAFALSLAFWLPLYRWTVSRWIGDYTVARIESGEIDLNYLLDEGGVFDELSDRVVLKFRRSAAAELGQMTHQAQSGEIVGDEAMGIDLAGEMLKAIGMKKPPALLQFKVAQALGQIVQNQAAAQVQPAPPAPDYDQFRP